MKVTQRFLLSMAMVMLGICLVVAGLHGFQGSNAAGLLYQQVQPATTPAGNTTVTPVASVTVTAVPSNASMAQLVDYGTDNSTYNRGSKANGYITLKNTGDTTINDVTISVTAARSVPALGTATLGTKDFKITDLNIQPGETKKAEFSVDIPSEYSGFSTAGDYDLNGDVLVDGQKVGSFSKHVTVV